MLQVDSEDALEQSGPAQATEVGGMGCLGRRRSGRVRRGGGAGDNRGPQLRVGREHAVEADEMQLGTGDERGQALQELERRHHDMGGAIVVGAFELYHDLTGPVACQPFIGDGRAADVPTKVFELMTLVDGEPHFGMEAKALLVDTALRRERRHSVRDALQGEYFLPGARPECDAVGAGGRLQGGQGAFGIGIGYIGHALLLNQIAFARQQSYESLYHTNQ